MANPGHRLSNTAVTNILKALGIEPASDRRRLSTWKSFLEARWNVTASVDFTTIEVWTRRGLATCYLLFFMQLATRRVHFAGLTASPDEMWMLQVAGNVTDSEEGCLRGKKDLLMDRDAKFSEAFRVTLKHGGVEAVRLPPRPPNLSAHIERFMRSVKNECLRRLVFFGEAALLTAVRESFFHFHAERNHQRIGKLLIAPAAEAGRTAGEIACRERLGGLLRYHGREAA